MRRSYLDYAMSVIIGRALPDVRDGLKPVHRRILYGMCEQGNLHGKPYKKSRAHRRRRARQVPSARRRRGLRLGRPHGAGLLACAIRSSTGRATSARSTATTPAAMRYTEVRLTRARGGAARRRHRQGDGRLGPQLRRLARRADRAARQVPEPARQRLVAASPSAWRRTSRRTTSARSSTPPSS